MSGRLKYTKPKQQKLFSFFGGEKLIWMFSSSLVAEQSTNAMHNVFLDFTTWAKFNKRKGNAIKHMAGKNSN